MGGEEKPWEKAAKNNTAKQGSTKPWENAALKKKELVEPIGKDSETQQKPSGKNGEKAYSSIEDIQKEANSLREALQEKQTSLSSERSNIEEYKKELDNLGTAPNQQMVDEYNTLLKNYNKHSKDLLSEINEIDSWEKSKIENHKWAKKVAADVRYDVNPQVAFGYDALTTLQNFTDRYVLAGGSAFISQLFTPMSEDEINNRVKGLPEEFRSDILAGLENEKTQAEEIKTGLLEYAQSRSDAATKRSEENSMVESISQIEDPLDALRFASNSAVEGMAQIPMAVMTFGGSSFVMSSGMMYLDAVESEVDKRMAQGQSKEEALQATIKDENINKLAINSGATIVAGLDLLGASTVLKGFGGNEAKKLAVKEMLEKFATKNVYREGAKQFGAFTGKTLLEAGTEVTQEVVEAGAKSYSTGGTIEEGVKELTVEDMVDVAVRSAIGASPMSIISSVNSQSPSIETIKQIADNDKAHQFAFEYIDAQEKDGKITPQKAETLKSTINNDLNNYNKIKALIPEDKIEEALPIQKEYEAVTEQIKETSGALKPFLKTKQQELQGKLMSIIDPNYNETPGEKPTGGTDKGPSGQVSAQNQKAETKEKEEKRTLNNIEQESKEAEALESAAAEFEDIQSKTINDELEVGDQVDLDVNQPWKEEIDSAEPMDAIIKATEIQDRENQAAALSFVERKIKNDKSLSKEDKSDYLNILNYEKSKITKGPKDSGAQSSPKKSQNAKSATVEDTPKPKVKETRKAKGARGDFEYDVDLDEQGNVIEVRGKNGKVISPTSKRNANSGKVVPNRNYLKIIANAKGEKTQNQINEENKQAEKEALDSFVPTSEFEAALEAVARGEKVSIKSLQDEVVKEKISITDWRVGMKNQKKVPSIERLAEQIWENQQNPDNFEVSEIRNALIEIYGKYTSLDDVKYDIKEQYQKSNDPYFGLDVDALAEAEEQRLTPDEKRFLNTAVVIDESLSDGEKQEYYEREFREKFESLSEEERRQLESDIINDRLESQTESHEESSDGERGQQPSPSQEAKNSSTFAEGTEQQNDEGKKARPQKQGGAKGPLETISSDFRESLERSKKEGRASQKTGKQELKDQESWAALKHAKEKGIWFDDVVQFGTYLAQGNENYVVLDPENRVVYKANNLFNTQLISSLFKKVELHNKLFPETKYSFVGYSGLDNGSKRVPLINVIFKQEHIDDATLATYDEIAKYMEGSGFKKIDKSTFTNGKIEVSDLHPRNVLLSEGNTYVIDAEFSEVVDFDLELKLLAKSNQKVTKLKALRKKIKSELKKGTLTKQEAFDLEQKFEKEALGAAAKILNTKWKGDSLMSNPLGIIVNPATFNLAMKAAKEVYIQTLSTAESIAAASKIIEKEIKRKLNSEELKALRSEIGKYFKKEAGKIRTKLRKDPENKEIEDAFKLFSKSAREKIREIKESYRDKIKEVGNREREKAKLLNDQRQEIVDVLNNLLPKKSLLSASIAKQIANANTEKRIERVIERIKEFEQGVTLKARKEAQKQAIKDIEYALDSKNHVLKQKNAKVKSKRISSDAKKALKEIADNYKGIPLDSLTETELFHLQKLVNTIFSEGVTKQSDIRALLKEKRKAKQLKFAELIAEKKDLMKPLSNRKQVDEFLANGNIVVVNGESFDSKSKFELVHPEGMELSGQGIVIPKQSGVTSRKIFGKFFRGQSFRDYIYAFMSDQDSQNWMKDNIINPTTLKFKRISEDRVTLIDKNAELKEKAFKDSKKELKSVLKRDAKLEIKDSNGEAMRTFTNSEVIYLYNALRMNINFQKALNSNFTLEGLSKVIDYVNSNKDIKAYADSLVTLYAEYLPEVNKALDRNEFESIEEKSTPTIEELTKSIGNENAKAYYAILQKIYGDNIPSKEQYTPTSVEGGSVGSLQGGDLFAMDKNEALSVISNNVLGKVQGGNLAVIDSQVMLDNYIQSMTNMVHSLDLFRDFQSVFSKNNNALLESVYGKEFVSNLKLDINDALLARNESVTNKDKSDSWYFRWLNRSSAVTMFFNTRSAIFQTISAPNNFFDTDQKGEYVANFFKMISGQLNEDFNEVRKLKWVKARVKNNSTSIELAEILGQDGTYQRAIDKALAKGYMFTSGMDALAIVVGGVPFYSIQKKKHFNELKKTMSKEKAMEKAKELASEDLYVTANQTQQSNIQPETSREQKNTITRIFLTFGSVSMQYNRRMLRAAKDIVNKRGNTANNLGIILYYGMLQNIAFNFLSKAVGELLGDEEPEEKAKNATLKTMQGVIDNLVKGFGVVGVVSSATVKTIYTVLDQVAQHNKDGKDFDLETSIFSSKEESMEFWHEVDDALHPFENKNRKPKTPEQLTLEVANHVAPTISIKARAVKDVYKGIRYGDELKAAASGIEFATNIPTKRIYTLTEQVQDALDNELDASLRVLRLTNVISRWDLENRIKKED